MWALAGNLLNGSEPIYKTENEPLMYLLPQRMD
jgi:hypothetical protein